tara:strand:- start:2085 stop:2690 length:606 start_codon:yes stop_codon:yes gene_type:complete
MVINCRRCQQSKPVGDFVADARYVRGYASWCRECHRERNSEWARENRQRLNRKSSAWRAANPEKAKASDGAYKSANREALAAKHAVWAKANRDKRRATDAAHKAAKKQARPSWANTAAIAAIYSKAVHIQKSTGERMHVDHIVPLQSPIVCGLHCEANLRIIPGRENEAKRNFWWPDMPEAYKQPRLFAEPVAKPIQEVLI